MYESCLEKQEQVKELFSDCTDNDSQYARIIELGRQLPPLPDEAKVDGNLVRGCQSKMYLVSRIEDGLVRFEADSDSLISSGLAMIMRRAYDGESPETILKCEPAFLQELGIDASLTMNRANGLASLHLRMKQDALKLLMQADA